jgi:hypothetical protein
MGTQKSRRLLVNRLIRLAAFQNPEFYAAQGMRLPTFGKSRVISCAEPFAKHIALPRGCLDAALDLLILNGIRPALRDERVSGTPLGTRFLGTLPGEQQAAADASRPMASHVGRSITSTAGPTSRYASCRFASSASASPSRSRTAK